MTQLNSWGEVTSPLHLNEANNNLFDDSNEKIKTTALFIIHFNNK
jgi:hypothetical protein